MSEPSPTANGPGDLVPERSRVRPHFTFHFLSPGCERYLPELRWSFTYTAALVSECPASAASAGYTTI